MSQADEPRIFDSACSDLAARCLGEVEGFGKESVAFREHHTATLAREIQALSDAYCRQVGDEIRAWAEQWTR